MIASSPHVTHKRLKRKEEILAQALRMITEAGIGSLTMQKLAEAHGLTAGALYRYFRSKAEIISALEGQILREMSERLAEELNAERQHGAGKPAQDTALGRLWICANFYLRQSAEQPEQATLITMLLADPQIHVSDKELPEIGADFAGLFGQLVGELAIAEKCGALAPGDAQTRALVFWSSLQGITSLRKLRRVDADFFDPKRVGAELVSSLLRGWGACTEKIESQIPMRSSSLADLKDKNK